MLALAPRPRRHLASVGVSVLASAEAQGVAWITAGGTVFGAIVIAALAAWTAGRRQKRQLAAEAARLTETLDHERGLADTADLRQLLDQAALAIDQMSRTAERADPRHPRERCEEDAIAIEAQAEVLDALHAQMLIRLGPFDDIALTFASATAAARELGDQLPIGDEPRDVESQQAREDGRQASWAQLQLCSEQFIAAAVRLAGSRLPPLREGEP
jgi:hypothetical protein